ncbi:MAG: hypothetical protein ACTSUE_17820 [Promethearchaeota archaeon]
MKQQKTKNRQGKKGKKSPVTASSPRYARPLNGNHGGASRDQELDNGNVILHQPVKINGYLPP